MLQSLIHSNFNPWEGLMKFRLIRKYNFTWLLIAAAVLAALSVLVLQITDKLEAKATASVLVSLVAGLLGLAYFLQTEHRAQTQLFYQLFKDFNSRYDKMNARLNTLLATPQDQDFPKEAQDTLYDYFNLCAEEYLYFRAGYIDPMVWEYWKAGIRVFLKHPRIKNLMACELQTGSYYGLTLTEIETAGPVGGALPEKLIVGKPALMACRSKEE